MIGNVFAVIGLVSFMAWMIMRSRSQRKFVPLLGILSGGWFIWLFSTDMIAYRNGENINFAFAVSTFLIGLIIILKSVQDLRITQ